MSAREEPPPGASKETQVGPVPFLCQGLLVGGGDNAVADLGLDSLGQENGGGYEKVHGREIIMYYCFNGFLDGTAMTKILQYKESQ